MVTKILCVIVVLLLAASLSAQPSGRLDSLRTRALASMNLPSSGTALVTTAIVNRIVNQSIGTVCADFPAIVKQDTLTWTITGEGASLPSDFLDIENVWRMSGDTIRIKLYTDSLYARNPGDTAGSKQNFGDPSSPAYYHVSGSTIAPFPKYMKPAGFVDSILVEYRAADRTLTADSMATVIGNDYKDALDWLILSNCYALRSMYSDAAYWQGKYNSLGPKRAKTVTK